jgi:hypothetical protein
MWRETTSSQSQFVDPKISHCTDDNEKPVEYHKECRASPMQFGLPAAGQGKPNHGVPVDGEGRGWQGVWPGQESLADSSLRANLHGC